MMSDLVSGQVRPGFEEVAEAFQRNLTEGGEVGAAFAAVHDGELVVDIWGGIADPATGRLWEADTLQLIYSGTKGLIAACLLILVDRGRIDLDAPVAAYWPEFAARGKGHITVADVMSHQARLPVVRTPLDPEDVLDPVRMAALIADQAPETDPRAEFTYHARTYGWMCAELIRRTDGRTAGTFFADEIARPLGLDLWIGLPAGHEDRVSKVSYAPSFQADHADDPPHPLSDDLAAWRTNPPLFGPGEIRWNTPRWHQAEFPSSNAIGTARSLARFYGCLARGGEIDGVRILSEAAVTLGRQPRRRGRETCWNAPMAYGIGFELQTELGKFGPPADAFGHCGAGGSAHTAWPTQHIGASYTMNSLHADPDPRARLLLSTLFFCRD